MIRPQACMNSTDVLVIMFAVHSQIMWWYSETEVYTVNVGVSSRVLSIHCM